MMRFYLLRLSCLFASSFFVDGQGVNISDPAFDDADVTLPDTVAESGLAKEGPAVILNTAGATETEAQRMQRLAAAVPEKNVKQVYEPTAKAKCFNEAYDKDFSKINHARLYSDYSKIFRWGFLNSMGSPLQSVSLGINNVTNNRFPGMFLRHVLP